MKPILINQRPVGHDQKPYIVAELSGNHHQDLDRALQLIDAAVESGVDAIKIQTYTPDTLTIDKRDDEFRVDQKHNLWGGTSLYELYEAAHTPWAMHEPIFSHCKTRGITCFSTPFDETAVDFLEDFDVPCYKIASFENIHQPLIKKIAATGKPLIISTGYATLAEIDEAVRTARDAGCHELILLKCTSAYPANPTDANIATLPHLKEAFHCPVGLSDHTMGLGVALASVALGACFIEKHFILDRTQGGPDAAFSMQPDEMAALVTETERAWESLGKIQYGPSQSEKNSLVFRRSLYIVEDLKAGDHLTPDNLRVIRPGYGISPKHYDNLLGTRVRKDIKRGTAMQWELIHD